MLKKNIYKRACGYCRFSSDRQREESIEAQQRFIREYAEKNGYIIEENDWYIDRGYSGKTVNRPSFKKMIYDIGDEECEYSAVIVHKLDRFSRNAVEAIAYKNILYDYGVELVSVSEKIENDASGKLLFGICANFNQYYIDNLSVEVLKGMRENAYKCQWNGGKPALGYDVVDKKLVINEREAVIVRKIFKMAAEGNGYNKIINELNRCGYLTKSGNKFGKNSLYDLLRNERYKGVYIFNQRSKRNSRNNRNNHKYKDESEIIRIENGCPAIVSEDLWERANASRKMAARLSHNAKSVYLLSGLLYCGECGSKLHGNHRKYGENGYNTYRCNKQANQLTCGCKEIRTDILEEFILNSFIEHFFNNPESIVKITEEVNNIVEEMKQADKEDIKSVKSSIKGLETARNNIAEAIAKSGYSQVLVEKLDSIEKQINQYKEKISQYEDENAGIKITEEDVKNQIENMKKAMSDPTNIHQTKLLLQSYIEKIVIDSKTVKATFKVAFNLYIKGERQTVCYNHTVTQLRKILEKK